MLKTSRRRIRFIVLAVFTLVMVSLVPVTASAVPHPGHEQPPRGNGPADPGNGNGRGNPNGSNGTIKIDGVASDGTFDGHPNNEPHVSCPFEVDLYGFDSEENGDTARLVFRHWPPTGSKQEIDADGFAVDQPGIDLPPVTEDGNHLIVPIDDDGAGGGVDIDREVRTFLDLPDSGAHPQHGFHVRLDAQITSGGREYKKTKVFWVTGCLDPKIDIEKFVNGDDADNPPGPTLDAGSTANFTYVVTNNGGLPLDGVAVVDNVVGPINCPRSELGVGESMNCTPTQMEAEVGDNFMEACVAGFYGTIQVDDCDPVYYRVPPPEPKVDIEKYVNGLDADFPPGPTLDAGSTATFTYVVTNTGPVALESISVDDNVVGAIDCPRTELGVGESMNCTPVQMAADPGDHSMESCVEGFSDLGIRATDCDPVYFRVPPPPEPKIDIEKYVEGQDADFRPGPTFESGLDVTFTYVVTNTGSVPVTDIAVVDNVVGPLSCPQSTLGAGDSMECDSTTMAVEFGQNFMEACVKGMNGGREVGDCDPVYYVGVKAASPAQLGDNVSYQHSGEGASDVKVDLFEINNAGQVGRYLGDTRTNDQGDYSFVVAPGCYKIVFIAPYGLEFVGGDKYFNQWTCVDAGETDNSLDAILKKLP